MGQKENDIWNLCRIKCGTLGAPLYRNNIGYNESIKVRYGLKVGSADGIGIMPITITQDMVGKRVGVFLSVETKATGKPKPDQLKWRDDVIARGGIAVIAYGPDDVPERWEFREAGAAQPPANKKDRQR